MAVTPTRVNQITQSWQFQRCKWAGPVEAWYRFKRNIFRIPAFSLRFFDVHVVASAVSKRISELLSPCERKGSRGVLLVEIHLPRGPSLWPTLVFEWAFARRERRLRLFWAFGRLCYISRGPSLGRLVIEWDLCPPREASLGSFGRVFG